MRSTLQESELEKLLSEKESMLEEAKRSSITDKKTAVATLRNEFEERQEQLQAESLLTVQNLKSENNSKISDLESKLSETQEKLKTDLQNLTIITNVKNPV